MSEKPRLLFVDDEPEILELLVLMFRDCEAQTALNTESALEILRKEEFDVLVTDIKMPGAGGMSLIDSAKKMSPDLAIVVITGHHQEMPEDTSAKVHQWLLKPFSRETIRAAVMSAFG
jgi:two-component system NtrC family response regulator